MERVARLGIVAEHHGPDPGLAGQAPRQVEADIVAGAEPVRGQEVVEPLVVDDGQIVPLRQVEPQHADAAVA